MKTIVVSRHKTYIQHLRNLDLIDDDTEIIHHVEDPESIRGARVIGTLPLHLAAIANRVIVVPLNLTLEQREREKNTGEELSIEEIKAAAGRPEMYSVEKFLYVDGRKGY